MPSIVLLFITENESPNESPRQERTMGWAAALLHCFAVDRASRGGSGTRQSSDPFDGNSATQHGSARPGNHGEPEFSRPFRLPHQLKPPQVGVPYSNRLENGPAHRHYPGKDRISCRRGYEFPLLARRKTECL